MRADGGEAVEVRRRGAVARRVVGGFQPLGTNRNGPGGAGGMQADGDEAVEVRWPRAQMKRTAAMVSEAVRRSASWSGCGAGCMPAWQTRRSRRHAGRWR